ncbi:DUF58 domain-containing protein [Candidatus Woesearchaeota archaeon]|nr:MAG: DUF58 domain-containing protein [Candidatus Woesearchaeota archaeon]
MQIKELDFELLEKIRKLDVVARKSTLSRTLEGNWTTIFKGRGMEFAGYRAYNYGDDASMIDWKASLRAKQILIKEYEEEKNLNVFFLIDVSNSMLFTSTDKLKCEYVIELVASLTTAILRSGDAVGLGMFTDKLVCRVDPNIGRSMQYRVIRQLINKQHYGGDFSFKKAIMFLLSFLKKKALIVIISDFIGLEENWYKYLDVASQRWEVIGIMVRDPRDRELPKNAGQYVLEDPYSNEKLYVDVNKYGELYKNYVQKEEAEIQDRFIKTRSGFLSLQTDQDFFLPIMGFFKRRSNIQLL